MNISQLYDQTYNQRHSRRKTQPINASYFAKSDTMNYENGPYGSQSSEIHQINDNGRIVERDIFDKDGNKVEIDKINGQIVRTMRMPPSRHVRFSNNGDNTADRITSLTQRIQDRTPTPYPIFDTRRIQRNGYDECSKIQRKTKKRRGKRGKRGKRAKP